MNKYLLPTISVIAGIVLAVLSCINHWNGIAVLPALLMISLGSMKIIDTYNKSL